MLRTLLLICLKKERVGSVSRVARLARCRHICPSLHLLSGEVRRLPKTVRVLVREVPRFVS